MEVGCRLARNRNDLIEGFGIVAIAVREIVVKRQNEPIYVDWLDQRPSFSKRPPGEVPLAGPLALPKPQVPPVRWQGKGFQVQGED